MGAPGSLLVLWPRQILRSGRGAPGRPGGGHSVLDPLVGEREAGVEQPPRQHPLAAEHLGGELAEHQPEADAGTRSKAGRCSTRPIARVNSALVTGCGAARLTGPRTCSASSRNRIARTSSASEIQLQYCRPEPSRPPSPELEQREQPASPAPPPRPQTTSPVRSAPPGPRPPRPPRSPPPTACTISARKPRPGGPARPPRGHRCRRTSRSPTRTAAPAAAGSRPASGPGDASWCRAPGCCGHPCSASVQRLSPMPAPARCTTASTPASAGGVQLPRRGSQRTSSAHARRPPDQPDHLVPVGAQGRDEAEPMRPDAPVTAIFMRPS